MHSVESIGNSALVTLTISANFVPLYREKKGGFFGQLSRKPCWFFENFLSSLNFDVCFDNDLNLPIHGIPISIRHTVYLSISQYSFELLIYLSPCSSITLLTRSAKIPSAPPIYWKINAQSLKLQKTEGYVIIVYTFGQNWTVLSAIKANKVQNRNLKRYKA